VAVDLAERLAVTAHLPDGQSVVATLTARIETLESEFAKVEAAAAVHRADFERERDRCERLMAEVLKATAEMMAAREAAARLAGELAAIQARPWWRRLVG
jgi:chromosome segregation ATPase